VPEWWQTQSPSANSHQVPSGDPSSCGHGLVSARLSMLADSCGPRGSGRKTLMFQVTPSDRVLRQWLSTRPSAEPQIQPSLASKVS
jgi:hypothetical protein